METKIEISKKEKQDLLALNDLLNLLNERALEDVVNKYDCPDNVLRLIGTFNPNHYGYGIDLYSSIANHENVSIDTLESMSKSELEYPLIAVAQSEKTPVSILEELSKSANVFVKRAVIRNDNINEKILNHLKNDESKDIKEMAHALSSKYLNEIVDSFENSETKVKESESSNSVLDESKHTNKRKMR